MDDDLAQRFEMERPRLRSIAARLVGAADADDAVQETWLRLARARAGEIENLPAWLTTVVSRVSLDRLRARRTRDRSWQVEPWRDEPVAEQADPAELVAQSDQVGVALQIVMETLSPAERIAFLLHDVFGQPFEEIAIVLDRSTDAARQLASRARRRVRGAPEPSRVGRQRQRRVVDAWLAAAQGGDFSGLLALLHDDAVLNADYGATTQRLEGAEVIVGQAMLAGRLAANSLLVLLDGRPGVAAMMHGRVVSLMAFDIIDDRILGLEVLADPDRLADVGIPGMT
ncbi:sigma-70 family RNA polymerase sigma factor [Glaciibacter flavus]|uniref:Sigma-70 family RNA polymerase sigma factor n=1 Tax=Orlajensenia flava TaxID=2565934 RepID=A0A4S4FXX1_9MICO|nr:sigma-70 family RNA polymerase sigma factor [Glaciibacter flavus]THG34566.1 sigma-70 family RNA polymerase sigma factor [Glaciibacter flavus]